MNEFDGNPIEIQQAWAILDGWKVRRQEIGVIFWGKSANVYTVGTVQSVRNGRVELSAEGTRATFNLAGAVFRYGPMQTWPRWPSPPIVEVNALRAQFENGDYLALAEGGAPGRVSSPTLPE